MVFAMSTTALAEETDVFAEKGVVIEKTMTTEYEIVLEEAKQFERDNSKMKTQAKENPLKEYEDVLKERAELSEEELLGYGYTDSQVRLLKEYADGIKTFEQIAPYATASITTSLVATTHTSKKYVLEYNWAWTAVPAVTRTDKVVLAPYGFNSNGNRINEKIDSKSASIVYYYLDGRLAQTNRPTVNVGDDISVNVDVPMYIMDSSQSDRIWAKRGTITCQFSPLGTSANFNGMRVQGSYGHMASAATSIKVKVTVNPAARSILITFTAMPGSTALTGMGTKQIVFYNNGNQTLEIG